VITVRIRLAHHADVPQLLPLMREYWIFEGIEGFEESRVGPVLSRLLAEPRLGSIWVAQAGGEIVGYLIAVHVLSLEHQGLMAEIDELFVVPEARSRGLGGQLLAVAESALAAGGCVRLQLQIGASNARGHTFYERRGYTRRAGYELLDKAL
jgi:GNAT superfamily N-acetyltransferase